jgi:hypothetical protein
LLCDTISVTLLHFRTPPEAETSNTSDDEAEESVPLQELKAKTKVESAKATKFAKFKEATRSALATNFENLTQMAVKEEAVRAAMVKKSAVEHIVLRPFASLNGLTPLTPSFLPFVSPYPPSLFPHLVANPSTFFLTCACRLFALGKTKMHSYQYFRLRVPVSKVLLCPLQALTI